MLLPFWWTLVSIFPHSVLSKAIEIIITAQVKPHLDKLESSLAFLQDLFTNTIALEGQGDFFGLDVNTTWPFSAEVLAAQTHLQRASQAFCCSSDKALNLKSTTFEFANSGEKPQDSSVRAACLYSTNQQAKAERAEPALPHSLLCHPKKEANRVTGLRRKSLQLKSLCWFSRCYHTSAEYRKSHREDPFQLSSCSLKN